MADIDTPYLEFIRSLTSQWPQLQLVADFASPDVRIAGYQSDRQVSRRSSHFRNVSVIDIDTSLARSQQHFSSLPTLKDYLEQSPSSLSHRIIICEDLSSNLIELLGGRYELDPRFFENHIRDFELFNRKFYTGDTSTKVEPSPHDILSQNFTTLKLVRPYPFENWQALYNARLHVNIPRLANVAENAYLRESISFYRDLRCSHGYTVYIIICDPLIDNNLPQEIHLRNHDPLPQFRQHCEYAKTEKRKHSSARSIIFNALLHLEQYTDENIENAITSTITEIALDFCAAALQELKTYTCRRTRQYSNHNNMPPDLEDIQPTAMPQVPAFSVLLLENHPPLSYETMLWLLNGTGGIMGLVECLWNTLSTIEDISLKRLPQSSDSRKRFQVDVENLLKVHADVQRRLNRIIDFLRQEQTMNETRRLVRVNMMAFLFVPFQAVAAVLGLQNVKSLCFFISLATPLFLLSFLVGVKGVSIGAMLRTLHRHVRVSLPNYWRAVIVGSKGKEKSNNLHDA